MSAEARGMSDPWLLDPGVAPPDRKRQTYALPARVRFPRASVPVRSLRASFNYGWR